MALPFLGREGAFVKFFRQYFGSCWRLLWKRKLLENEPSLLVWFQEGTSKEREGEVRQDESRF